MARSSVFAVANYILGKAAQEGIAITPLQLQKLVYFCYAWFAGNTGEELFPEDIEAWQYGPVVRELYLKFRASGSAPITQPIQSMDWTSGEMHQPQVNSKLAEDLQSVWDSYKDKTAGWLVYASHAAGEPWAEIAGRYGSQARHRIPFDLIRKIYAQKVQRIAA